MEKTVIFNQYKFSQNYETDINNNKSSQQHSKITALLCKQQFFENKDLKCQFGGENKDREKRSVNIEVQVQIQAQKNKQQLEQEKEREPKVQKKRKLSIQKNDKVKKSRKKKEKSSKIQQQKEKKINKKTPTNLNKQLFECFCGRLVQTYDGLKNHVHTKHKYYKQYNQWFSLRYFLRRKPTKDGKTVIKLQQLDLYIEFGVIQALVLQFIKAKKEFQDKMKKQSTVKSESNVQVKIEQIDQNYKRQPTNVIIQEQTMKKEQTVKVEQSCVHWATFKWKHLLTTNKDIYHYHLVYMYETNKHDLLTQTIFHLLRNFLQKQFFSKFFMNQKLMNELKYKEPLIFKFIQNNFHNIAKAIDGIIKKHFQSKFSVSVENVSQTINDFLSWLKVKIEEDKKQTQESDKLCSTVKKQEKMQDQASINLH